MDKPRVERVDGLSPTLSIDQKTVNRNPRSTVGTITEIGDHLRFTSKNEGFSQIASSMEVNHQKVNIARKGDDVAIKVDRPVKKRDLVFKVMQK